MKVLSRLRRIDYRGWIGLLAVILTWQIVARVNAGGSILFVTLGDIGRAAVELTDSGELWENYRLSLIRVSIGFGFGASIGFALGTLLGTSAIARRLVGPLFDGIRQVPMFGWVPLIGLWFGLGETSKTILIALATLYPVTLSTFEGFRGVPATYREVATVLLFSRWQLVRRVLLPGALPHICTGLRQGLSFAWIAVVGAEMFMTASPGIGAMLVEARAEFRIDVLMLGMALIGATGFLMNYLMILAERRVLRWAA